MSRSIQGKAFSWPMARITRRRAGRCADDLLLELPLVSVELELLELHADQAAVLDEKRCGDWFSTISTCSSSASSSSQGEALKYLRGRGR
jgi:hypothetical protein